jgi:predicted transcriptional regulator
MQKPTDSELEILQVLWENGPSTVREIHDKLAANRNVVYTTILKLMQIMNEKGFVTRQEANKAHIYSAAITQNDTQQQFVDKIVDAVFGGSVMNLVMQALGNRKSSKEELDAIKEYLESIEKEEDSQS